MKKLFSTLIILVMMLTFIPTAFADDGGVVTPITSDSCTVTLPDDWASYTWTWNIYGGSTKSVTPVDGVITISLKDIITSDAQRLFVNMDGATKYRFEFKSSDDSALDGLDFYYPIPAESTETAITGVNTFMEYRSSGTDTYTKVMSSSLALPAGTYFFRISSTKATGSVADIYTYSFPSEDKAVVVSSAPAPGIFEFISPTECKVTVPTDWEHYYYWIDNGAASEGTPTADGFLNITVTPDKDTAHTLNVSDTTSLKAGYSFKFKAPNRTPLEKLAAAYSLGKDATKAKITNATNAMEYRLSDGNDFTDASASLELPLGDYQFRMKATKAEDVFVAPSTIQNVSVTPYDPPTPPTQLAITDPASSCTFPASGTEHWFVASLLPEDSDKSGYTITWASSNPNVAKVTDTKENGTKARIVSVAAGTCDITARCEALGLSSVRTVSVQSDFRFTSKNKLIFYYDNRSKTDCNFATTIPADMVSKVTVNGYSLPFYKDTKGNSTVLYSTLLNTFGSKSARMPLRVYYGEGSNQYIEKTLYYMSIYDAPLTADTDMTWAYVTLLISGLFITASPFVLKKKHQN